MSKMVNLPSLPLELEPFIGKDPVAVDPSALYICDACMPAAPKACVALPLWVKDGLVPSPAEPDAEDVEPPRVAPAD